MGAMATTADPEPTDAFRILSVDSGGIRGLIPALVIAELERRLQQRTDEGARVSDYFQMLAGTSTGGLIALGLTAPDPERPTRPRVSGEELAALYIEDGPSIFHRSPLQRLRTLDGYAARSTRSLRWSGRSGGGSAPGRSRRLCARSSSPPTT